VGYIGVNVKNTGRTKGDVMKKLIQTPEYRRKYKAAMEKLNRERKVSEYARA
jgi:hypothetical protein